MLKRKEKTQIETTNLLNRLVEGTKIAGDVITSSILFVEGEIVGNVYSQSKVIIGISGKVFGNIKCLEADIEGQVDGSIDSDGLLILRDNSKIIGDIKTVKLHIEEGAIFLGSCQMIGHETLTSQAHLNPSTDSIDE